MKQTFHFLFLFIPLASLSQAGLPDPNFGNNGLRIIGTPMGTEYVKDMAIQSDGKILTVGNTVLPGEVETRIDRLLPDGGHDPSFNGTGALELDLVTGEEWANAILLDHQGRILVLGDAWSGSKFEPYIIRLEPNGALDTTFGTLGMVRLVNYANDASGQDLVLQSDGSFMIAGYSGFSQNEQSIFARIDSLEQVLCLGGGIGPGYRHLRACDQATDSTVIMVGDTDELSAGQNLLMLMYKPLQCSIASEWASNGFKIVSVGNWDSFLTDVVVQPDGKILAVGYSGPAANKDIILYRTNADGSSDQGFGPLVLTDIAGYHDRAHGVKIDNEGRILVCGETQINGTPQPILLRYLTNGVLDSTFSSNGYSILASPGQEGRGFACAVQDTCRVIMGGEIISSSSANGFVSAYHSDSCSNIATAILDIEENKKSLSVNPNPNNGTMRIYAQFKEGGGQVYLEVFNSKGALVESTSMTNARMQLTIDIDPGLYFIRAAKDDEVCLGKVLIE